MCRINLVVSIAVLVALSPGALAAGSSDYFPLVAGTRKQWVTDSSAVPRGTAVVVGQTTFHGRQVWAIETRWESRTNHLTYYYSVESDGDVLYHGARDTHTGGLKTLDWVYEPPLRVLEAPLVAGQQWTDTVEHSRFEDGVLIGHYPNYRRHARVVEENASITVPAGEFTALRVSYTEPSTEPRDTDVWYVSGIGSVHTEVLRNGYPYASSSLWEAPTPTEARSWGSLKAAFE